MDIASPQEPDFSSNVHAQSIENIRALIVSENLAQNADDRAVSPCSGVDAATIDKDAIDGVSGNEAVFKKPQVISALIKKLSHNIDRNKEQEDIRINEASTSQQRSYKIVDSNTNVIQNVTANRKKVDVTIPDTGPKFYKIKPPYCTATIVPTRLPAAFESLPKVGRVENKADLAEQQTKKLREFLGDDVDDDQFKHLEQYCSPDNLRLGTELKLASNAPTLNDLELEEPALQGANPVLEDGLLKTVDKHRMRQDLDQKNLFMRGLKYRGMRVMPLHLKNMKDDERRPPSPGSALQPGKELIFGIRLYRPFVYHPKERVLSNGRHPLLACDLVFLGRQPLRQLRARLPCVNDVGLRVDVARAPALPAPLGCKELFPSGFFFINNTFFVDRRGGCGDLSAAPRAWAARRGLGTFPVRDMDGVAFQELQVKLGHPEVYVHQGNCEHLFTFSQVRLLSASDPLSAADYPRHTVVARQQAVYCTTCAEFPSKYLVTGCSLVPFDPALFCELCLQMYLYKDGAPLMDFKVYQYHYNDVGLGGSA